MVILSPFGTAPTIPRDRIVEAELALLDQLHDHGGGHRLGVRGRAEVSAGGRRVGGAKFGRAVAETNSPCGVHSRTIAPGSISSLAVASMTLRSAAGSMGLRFVSADALPLMKQIIASTIAGSRTVMNNSLSSESNEAAANYTVR